MSPSVHENIGLQSVEIIKLLARFVDFAVKNTLANVKKF